MPYWNIFCISFLVDERQCRKIGFYTKCNRIWLCIACALERYHLTQGDYPETLDALAPQLINNVPHDIIGGKPLLYRRISGKTFTLYSVGWNETDDGGQVGLSKYGSLDRNTGDWVWQTSAAIGN